MLAVIPASVSLLAINLLFASIALAVGFGVGVWMFGSRNSSTAAETESDGKAEYIYKRAAERAVMASQRIQDLAKGMASDVGTHASQVEAMTDNLKSIAEEQPGGASGAMFVAIGRIVEANSQLQQRLAVAEQHIETQAAELRSYESEARTDSLTGLANRRAFDDEMNRRFSEWQRRKTLFTLMILDIDHFKQFNDSHGHQAGDEVLRSVGSVLLKTARQMDVPCRYGGEEFAIILSATRIQEARIAAERFRKAIESSVTTFDGKRLSITSSIGVAQVNPGDDPILLIRRADDALYKSKEAGRNCGHWHDGQQCLPVVAEAAPPATITPKKATDGDDQAVNSLPSGIDFGDVLQRRVVESHRFGLPLSILYLSIDDYPTIAQDYGKSTAQMAINSVATFFNSALREMDLLARLEDGEFVAMLPGSTQAEATQVAKRMQTAMANCTVPLSDQQARLNFSHGIAQLKPNETAPLLMARAKGDCKAKNVAAV